jgi:hypothetical protein
VAKNITVSKVNILTSFRDPMPVTNPKCTSASIIREARQLFAVGWTHKKPDEGRRSSGSLNSIPSVTQDEPTPLNISIPSVCHLRRLVLEDLLLLIPSRSDPYVLLVESTHPMYDSYLKRQAKMCDALPNVNLGSKVYVQMALFVTDNPRRIDFLRGLLDSASFAHLVIGNGNTGFAVSYHGGFSDGEYALSFNEFLDGSMQLWGTLSHTRDWRTALKNKSNVDSRQRLFSRLATELHGDVASLMQLCAAYAAVSPVKAAKPSASVLTETMLSGFDLGINGDVLTTASVAVDAIIMARIELCYGEFISWSDPILEHSDLVTIQAVIFESFPLQIQVIRQLLGYERKGTYARTSHLELVFDRTVLFQFFSLARVRHNKNFILWALITTAVTYGSSQRGASNRVGLFFGQACTFHTFLTKTKHLCVSDPFFKRVDKAVEAAGWTSYRDCDGKKVDLFIALCYFDNSQRNTRYKFQRGGSSGNMVRLTSRAMERPWFGLWREKPIPPMIQVPIVYLDQCIPSPSGMGRYERLLAQPQSLQLFAQVILDPACTPIALWPGSPPFDSTGRRVLGYVSAVLLSCNLRLLHRHLSVGLRFRFCPADFDSSSSLSTIAAVLRQRRGRGDVMHQGASFLRRSVQAYRGDRSKAYILSLPAISDDEVTLEGMVNVAIKTLRRCLLLVPGTVAGQPA